ncbi:MAG: bacterial extracellular solute-binding family protein, partial [Proteobacteria bacterium]|nr:bacterial extracellular solute-binding family protein [Pseudomonadota bacterium]
MHAPDELIGKLLKAWHFLYRRGFIEGFGHLSARIPDSDLFLLARHSLGPRAVAEDFLVVDLRGRKVAGTGDLPGEF